MEFVGTVPSEEGNEALCPDDEGISLHRGNEMAVSHVHTSIFIMPEDAHII